MLSDRKMLGLIAIAVLGLLIAIAQPFAPGLSPLGHYIMGTVIAALGMWIFRPGMLPFMAGSSVILGVALALFFAFKAGLVFPGKVLFRRLDPDSCTIFWFCSAKNRSR
jgi:L-tartrate/succinate antiporter